MNVKKIDLIFIFALFLILTTSPVYSADGDNSTEFVSPLQDCDSILDDENLSGSSDFEGFDWGQWRLDENGNLVNVFPDKNHSTGNFTDLRNGNAEANDSDIVNQTQTIPSVSSPAVMNIKWDEFIKNPWGYFNRYDPQSNPISINFDDYVNDNPCNAIYSKQFNDFMNYVKQNNISSEIGSGNGNQAGDNVVKSDINKVNSKIGVCPLFKTKNIIKKYKKPSKFTIKLIKQKGKSISKQKVRITFKGKNYYVKTNSKGIAVFNVSKNLKIGKYYIKTAYKGYCVTNKITVMK